MTGQRQHPLGMPIATVADTLDSSSLESKSDQVEPVKAIKVEGLPEGGRLGTRPGTRSSGARNGAGSIRGGGRETKIFRDLSGGGVSECLDQLGWSSLPAQYVPTSPDSVSPDSYGSVHGSL